jgi:hypothetical protein
VLEIVTWKNPALSALIFCAWMHCIYKNAFSLVLPYFVSFLLLMMIRTYVLYGSDGPIQDGFIPPSWEEMCHALLKGGETQRIESLKIKPKRSARRTYKSVRNIVDAPPQTHKQRGKWFFKLLGFRTTFEDAAPEDYHMEFPFSQGLQNPATQTTHYPKFTVKESLVSKVKLLGKNKKKEQDDDGENMLGDLMNPLAGAPKKEWSMDLLNMDNILNMDILNMGKKKEDEETTQSVPVRRMQRENSMDSWKKGGRNLNAIPIDELPPRLRIPDQDENAKIARTKKLGDELNELRDNLHKLTFHLFHDKTHLVRQKDACYFGQANWGRAGQVDNELERLLNIGQYSSANPVVARVGLYVEPIISAAHSFLCLSRAVYNVVTWRDPILSFWVTLLLAAAVVVLAIFPWRLFCFVTGFVIVGPQNWILRVMDERGTTPKRLTDFLENRRTKQEEKKKTNEKDLGEIPRDQPIISGHMDNAPPIQLSFDDVNLRELHEVSIPYSQLMYQRMYDWPPEPQYAKCVPTGELEQAQEELRTMLRSRHGSAGSNMSQTS